MRIGYLCVVIIFCNVAAGLEDEDHTGSGSGRELDEGGTFPSPTESEFEMTDSRNESTTGIVVDIVVVNDFEDLPPPFYHLTTSITLICHVHGAHGHIMYSWMTTAASNFTTNSSSVFNRQPFLTYADTGVYTCSVTDSERHTGEASLEIKFNGADIYLAESHNYKAGLVANNSFIVHHPDSCSNQCLTDIYCYSNSSLMGTGAVIFPNGVVYSSNSTPYTNFNVEILHSAIHLVVPNTLQGSTHLNEGIFTFVIPDSNGNMLPLSLGLYSYSYHQGPPVIYDSSDYSGFTDLTKDNSTSTMAELVCYTTNVPPTKIVWLRNGEEIDIDGVTYVSQQIVVDRINSHYRNILLVKEVINFIGNLTFTCNVSNLYGNASLDISTHVAVIPTVHITPQLETNYGGRPVVLECDGAVNSVKPTAQLSHGGAILVEWFGPNQNPLKGTEFDIGNKVISSTGSSRTLSISDTNIGHSGLYTCQVTLDLLDADASYTVVSQYHLVLLKNLTVQDVLPDRHSVPSSRTDDIVCAWNGGEIVRMEWLFLGENTIVPMEVSNSSWNDVEFACIANYDNEPELIHLRVKASFTNDVSIEASDDQPTAGNNFTLTCTVISDRTPTLKWVGNGIDSEGVVVHPQSVSGFESILVIEFSPLRTSHGGMFTCVSSISPSPSAHDSQLHFSLGVKIPAPTVKILTDPSDPDQHIFNMAVSLLCIIEYASEVDTDVMVHASWKSNTATSLENDTRITFREERLNQTFTSTLTINSLLFSDSDVYTCIGNVLPEKEYSSAVVGSSSNEELLLTVHLDVSISVEYTPPPDFYMPSPPYYRPASSVTLECVVANGTTPMRYSWTSTCDNCFASYGSSKHVSTDILIHEDAGTHKCSVTDADGNTGFATTEMQLIGAGVYVEQSHDISSAAVANNTLIRLSCLTCDLSFVCHSNTPSFSRRMMFSTGGTYVSYSSRQIAVGYRPSGFYFDYTYSRYGSGLPPSGLYTCMFTDIYGRVKEISIGVSFEYETEPVGHTVNSSSYKDLSGASSLMVEYTCISDNSPPTNVTWLRNGKKVFNALRGYDMSVAVRNRLTYQFASSLIVTEVAGIMGNITYTCIIQNRFGQVSQNITFDNTVSSIVVPTKPFYGNEFTLKCRARLPPSDYEVDMQLEWFEPNGPITADSANVVTGQSYRVDGYIQRDATFSYPTPTQNGQYTCQLTAYFQNNETLVEITEYHLEVLSKLTTNSTQKNIFLFFPGHTETIACSWNGNDVNKLEWFLEGAESIPILSVTNTSFLALSPDPSTSGLNGTKFTCKATTHNGHHFEETVTLLTKDVKVNISVSYNPPSDFHLPSPPYYRPASSVQFTCSVYGAIEPIRYYWTTNSSYPTFAYQRFSPTLRIDRMTASAAGLYTCTILEGDGVVLSASTTIQLDGGGIYVELSKHNTFEAVANNTAQIAALQNVFINFYSYPRYRFNFLCSTNASINSGSIVLPNGTALPGLYFKYDGSSHPPTGIYTCQMRDSNGFPVDMSVGVNTLLSQPYLVHKEFYHFNGSLVPPGPVLAAYTCYTTGSPPTTVSWIRNNAPLIIDDIRYSTMQIVINRSNSSYKNVLLVYNLTDILGDPVFRCSVHNAGGSTFGDIREGLTVSATTHLRTSAEPEYNTQFLLVCQASLPSQYIRHLSPYIKFDWFISENVISQLQTDISIVTEMGPETFTSTLTFLTLNTSHNGNYTCQTFLRLPHRNLTIGQSNSLPLFLEAINVTGNEETHIIGQPAELICVGKDTEIRKIEWISDSRNTTLAADNNTNYLSLTVNTSLIVNSAWFTCRTTTIAGIQQEKRVLVKVRELMHSVDVTPSSKAPVVGENYTLTCTVTSDLPATITWFGSNHNTSITVTRETLPEHADGKVVSRSHLSFNPLHVSHGAVYTCNSIINITSSRRTVSKTYQLKVQIPPPHVTVSRETKEEVQIGSIQTLNCSVIVQSVDISVRLTIEWSSRASVLNESTIILSGTKENKDTDYYLALVFDSYKYNDTGTYVCTAFVVPTADMSTVVETGNSSSSLSLVASNAFKMSIRVDYNPPSDFSLPSPPYYRPASSVTLTCIAHDAIGFVLYQWTSTGNRSFVHGRNGSSISQRLLTAFDAGVHTCEATDKWGNTASITTEMSLFGMGIYIEESQHIANTSVANNTHLYLQEMHTCGHECRNVSFSCLSNMTDSIVIMAHYPKKSEFYYSYALRQYLRREIDPWHVLNLTSLAGLSMSLLYSRDDIARGTYTCEATSSSLGGESKKMSIGVYLQADQPTLYKHNYTDFTDDLSTSTLAVVTCETRFIQPQLVSWLRNGDSLSIDGHDYETNNTLSNREGSEYIHNLVIRDAIGLINSPTYTCRVTNSNVTLTWNTTINVDLEVTVNIDIVVPSQPVYGDDYTLLCTARTLESKSALTHPLLRYYLEVEWFDINSVPVSSQRSLTVGGLTSNFSRALHFKPVRKGHDRLYVCVATLNIPGDKVNATAQYRIVFDTAYLQLKFDQIPCTFLSENPYFAVELESTIKSTLIDVINKDCRCNFTSEMIGDSEFSCIKSQSITYRVSIDGSSDVQPTVPMIDSLQTWKRSYGTILFDTLFNFRLWVDPFCPLEIRSFRDPLCPV